MTTWINCTGDVVAGDTIRFTEAVFGGSFRSPKFIGDRIIIATVERESYGGAKQQHTFSLKVIESSGTDPLAAGAVARRKGRNIYRNGTERLLWTDEAERRAAAAEKHGRGDRARAAREARREETRSW